MNKIILGTQELIILSWVSFILSFCKENSSSHPDELNTIKISSHIESFDSKGNKVEFKSMRKIHYYKDFILFEIPFLKNKSQITLNKSGEIVRDTFYIADTSYKYFLYSKGSKLGFFYDSLSEKETTKIPVDSFLNENTLTSFEVFFEKKINKDTLISTEFYGPNNIIEKYIPKTKQDDSFSDTTVLVFDKELSDINFSFYPSADKRLNSKLCEIKLIYSQKEDSIFIGSKQKRYTIFKLEKISNNNSIQILNFLKKVSLKN